MKQLLLLFLFFANLGFAGNYGVGKIENEKLTLTVLREKVAVKLIITCENVKRYENIVIERGEVIEGPYRQVKLFLRDRITASTDNSITDHDNFPMAVKNGGYYRVRTEEANGTMRVFPGVHLVGIFEESKISMGNFSETKNYTGQKGTASKESEMKDATSSHRDVEEISSNVTVKGGEKEEDVFDKYKNAKVKPEESDAANPYATSKVSTLKSKNGKDVITAKGSGIQLVDSKDSDEPMYTPNSKSAKSSYSEYTFSGLSEENKNNAQVKDFMKTKVVENKNIALDVLLEKESIATEVLLDDIGKYYEAIIEYADAADGSYKPFKKFGSSFIADKFVDNKFTIIEPFYAPKGKKSLYFRLKLIQSDGNEFVTKATPVAFP
jgi:hypothetical protein